MPINDSPESLRAGLLQLVLQVDDVCDAWDGRQQVLEPREQVVRRDDDVSLSDVKNGREVLGHFYHNL